MKKYYKIKVTSVDYDITTKDVIEDLEETLNHKPTDEEVDAEIKNLELKLPQELNFEITCESEDLEEVIADTITNETGWCINNYTYDVIEEGEIEENELFFNSDEGDLEAEEFARENNIKDYELEWDNIEKGYRLTWNEIILQKN